MLSTIVLDISYLPSLKLSYVIYKSHFALLVFLGKPDMRRTSVKRNRRENQLLGHIPDHLGCRTVYPYTQIKSG